MVDIPLGNIPNDHAKGSSQIIAMKRDCVIIVFYPPRLHQGQNVFSDWALATPQPGGFFFFLFLFSSLSLSLFFLPQQQSNKTLGNSVYHLWLVLVKGIWLELGLSAGLVWAAACDNAGSSLEAGKILWAWDRWEDGRRQWRHPNLRVVFK